MMQRLRSALCATFLYLLATSASAAPGDWRELYQPVEKKKEGIPCRVMKPINFDAGKNYPVIVSLHGTGGKGADNRTQLKNWNQQLAEKQRREKFPCYVVAPQAPDLWNGDHLKQIKAVIKGLPSADMDRIYVLGHSMGGHGTFIFIQLDPDYFAAAAPSAGSGLKRTENFIDAKKIKDIPLWVFHGDKDSVCPIEKDLKVFEAVKKLGGNMKFTTWAGGKHGVSDKFITGDDSGSTQLSGERCDKENDFMTWLFKQKREAKKAA